MLQQIAKILALCRSGLLAYYEVIITSGPMEGINNKIKTMKRQRYGFRDRESFKLKILAIHETRYELVGRSTPGTPPSPTAASDRGTRPLTGTEPRTV